MNDKEFQKLKDGIREAAARLSALQDIYRKETGRYMFVDVTLPKYMQNAETNRIRTFYKKGRKNEIL